MTKSITFASADHDIEVGDTIRILPPRRPRWWNVVAWIRWLFSYRERRRLRGHFYVTHVGSTTLTISGERKP